MSVRRPTMRSSASLLAGLLIAATMSSGATPRPTRIRAATAAIGAGAPAAARRPSRSSIASHYVPRTVGRRAPNNVRRLAARKPTVRPVRTCRCWAARPARRPAPRAAARSRRSPPRRPSMRRRTLAMRRPYRLRRRAQSTTPPTTASRPTRGSPSAPSTSSRAVNLMLDITDRQGADPLSVCAGRLLPAADRHPDLQLHPHVIYDSLHGRWIATEVSWDCDTSFGGNFGTGYIDFAVSHTADPNGTWNHGFFYWPDQLPDFPAPGTSTDKVAFASNLFTMTQAETSLGAGDCLTGATLDQGDIVYMDWADLINGGAFDAAELPLGDGLFGPRVAVQVPATSPALQQVFGYDAGGGALGAIYFTVVGTRRRHARLSESSVGPRRDRHHGPVDRSAPARPGRDGHDRLGRGRPPDRRALAGRPAGHRVDVSVRDRAPRLRPGHRARDGRCHRFRPTHGEPGLPRPGVGQGPVHGRDRARRQRHPPRGLDPLVRERRPVVVRRPPIVGDAANSISRSRAARRRHRPLHGRALGPTMSASPRTRRSRTRSGTPTSTPAAPDG